MSTEETAVRRALQALRSAAQEAEDEHPGIDVLEAYVEGRLSPDERAEVERLAARSSLVAEDLADLQAIDRELAARPVATRHIRWGRIAGAAAVAATLVAGIWLSLRPVPIEKAAPSAARGLSDAERRHVDAIVSSGRITLPPAVAEMIRPPGTLLGASPAAASLAPLAPIGTALRSVRPSFTWTAQGGADAYTVAIYDQQFAEIARSPRVAGTSWTPSVDLQRGAAYVWQVTAHRAAGDITAPQPPAPEARFLVIDASTLARVEAFEARAAGDSLALGVLLADAGLVTDARAQLDRAAREPATANVAKRLLASLDR